MRSQSRRPQEADHDEANRAARRPPRDRAKAGKTVGPVDRAYLTTCKGFAMPSIMSEGGEAGRERRSAERVGDVPFLRGQTPVRTTSLGAQLGNLIIAS